MKRIKFIQKGQTIITKNGIPKRVLRNWKEGDDFIKTDKGKENIKNFLRFK